jgi:hypothetical protein
VRPWKLEWVGCKYCLQNLKKNLYVFAYIKLLFYILYRYMKALVISWDHYLCAFVAKGGLQAFQPVLHVLSCGHSLTSGQPKKCSCNSELMNYLFSQIFAFSCCLKSSVTKDGHPLCSLWCTLVLPSLINQHHYLTFVSSIHCTFTIHFNNLPVNFCQTDIFTI